MRQLSIHKCLSLDFNETMDGVHAIVERGPQSKRRDKKHEKNIFKIYLYINVYL